MFDWFRKDKGFSNVVRFPTWKDIPPPPELRMPEEEPKEKPAKIFYRFGITDNNRLAFQMGYSEITMNKEGVQDLIDQLEFFKEQLSDEE